MQGVSTARLPGATAVDIRATGSRTAIGRLIGALGLAVVLFTLAYIPRTLIIGSYLTTDEGNWMGRTALFTQGILRGDPYATYQSGHPGVTTMWTALAGMGVDRALGLVEYVRPDGLEKAPDYLDTLRQARKWFPAVTSLAVALIGLLAWRLAGPAIGILSAVLVGLEPFFLAHSVVAHLDGALTAYMTLSALCALIYFWAGGGRGYLVGCAVATALAFLTKAPASFLALFVPFLAGLSLVPAHRRTIREFRGVMFSLAVWGLIIGAITLVLWPAFRADPIWALRSMIDYTEAVGGSDHENFFLGQPVADPGPLYYLVTIGFRLTPVTVIGLALLPLGLLLAGKERRRYLPFVGFLCAFILLFWAMMALPPKKFDRYMLPVFPSLEMLAAVGYWLVIRRFASRFVSLALGVATIGLGVLQILPAQWCTHTISPTTTRCLAADRPPLRRSWSAGARDSISSRLTSTAVPRRSGLPCQASIHACSWRSSKARSCRTSNTIRRRRTISSCTSTPSSATWRIGYEPRRAVDARSCVVQDQRHRVCPRGESTAAGRTESSGHGVRQHSAARAHLHEVRGASLLEVRQSARGRYAGVHASLAAAAASELRSSFDTSADGSLGESG